MRKKYKKRPDQFIIAVQLDIETDGLTYKKWGALQKAKPGDWLVNNDGEIYTIDQDVFKRTYKKIDDGKYIKLTPIWAEKAKEAGSIKTKEGRSHYKAGDYLVFNNADGNDVYCVSSDKFRAMYERV